MKRKQLIAFAVMGVVCLSVTQSKPQSPPNQIASVREEWVRLWNSNQFDALAALYSQDADLLPPTGVRIVGPQAIANFFRDAKTSQGQRSIQLSPTHADVVGTLAFESGQYVLRVGGGGVKLSGGVKISGGVTLGGPGRELHGSYLVVLTRSRDRWLVVEHAFTQAPPPSE